MAKTIGHYDPKAHEAYTAGRYVDAIKMQVDHLNRLVKEKQATAEARKMLSLYCYSAGDLPGAIGMLKSIEEEKPEDGEIPENIGVMLKKMGQNEEAVTYLRKAYEMKPDSSNICDGLAHVYSVLEDEENTQIFGRKSLEMKDAAAAASAVTWPIPEGKPKPFDYEDRSRNIISFSLWGDNERYLKGALRNSLLAYDMYPSWTCRFYCDNSVPAEVRQQLKDHGSQVVMRPRPEKFYEGLLWRFEVVADPDVDRYLVRDADSVINVKERVAVDEWIESDFWFHSMRDFASHTEVLLAGMWGGCTGVLPSLPELEAAFRSDSALTLTYDQQLLRNCAWPTIRKSVMIHDSVYTGCLGSIPFPPFGRQPKNRHVGQNEFVHKNAPSVSLPEKKAERPAQTPKSTAPGLAKNRQFKVTKR